MLADGDAAPLRSFNDLSLWIHLNYRVVALDGRRRSWGVRTTGYVYQEGLAKLGNPRPRRGAKQAGRVDTPRSWRFYPYEARVSHPLECRRRCS